MAVDKHKRSKIRGFERTSRIQALFAANLIQSPSEIPEDAIPARPEFVEQCRNSLRARHRPPYFRLRKITCIDCQQEFAWTAEDQRYWYETLGGSIYSEATSCQNCRTKRKEGSSRRRSAKATIKEALEALNRVSRIR